MRTSPLSNSEMIMISLGVTSAMGFSFGLPVSFIFSTVNDGQRPEGDITNYAQQYI